MSLHPICGARGWHRQAVLATSIVSFPLLASLPGRGQTTAGMPGMEQQHQGDAAVSHQPAASTPHAKRRPSRGNRPRAHRSPRGAMHVHDEMPGRRHGQHGMDAMPGMKHGEHGMEAMPGMQHGEHGMEAMPGMQHGEHGMGGMQMKGQFGPYSMEREASGTAWQPDSTPHQGVMFLSGQPVRRLRPPGQAARRRQDLRARHGDGDGAAPSRRSRNARLPRHVVTRSIHGRERLPASLCDRRDRERADAAD